MFKHHNKSVRSIIKRMAMITMAVATVTLACTLMACGKEVDNLERDDCVVIYEHDYWNPTIGEVSLNTLGCAIHEEATGNDENIKECLIKYVSEVFKEETDMLVYSFDGSYSDKLYRISGFYHVGDECYAYTINVTPESEELYNVLREACKEEESYRHLILNLDEGSKLPHGSNEEWDYGTVEWCENHQMSNSQTREKIIDYVYYWTGINAQDVVLFQQTTGSGGYQVYVKVDGTWYEGYMYEDEAPLNEEERNALAQFVQDIRIKYLQSDDFVDAQRVHGE